MTRAFETIPGSRDSGLLLVCDHASRAFPPRLGTLGLAEPQTWEHIAWDIGAGDLTRALAARLGVPAILAGWSRLVVDCNRRLEHEEAFPAVSGGIPIPGNARLSAEDRAWRITNCFEPYHAAIAASLDDLEEAGVAPVLVSVHSFTALLGDQARPWHAGILWDRDGRLAQPLLQELRAVEGLQVGDNEPYSGRHPTDYTVHMHGARRGIAHVALEVRQDLLATEEGIGYWAGLLSNALSRVLQAPRVRERLLVHCAAESP